MKNVKKYPKVNETSPEQGVQERWNDRTNKKASSELEEPETDEDEE